MYTMPGAHIALAKTYEDYNKDYELITPLKRWVQTPELLKVSIYSVIICAVSSFYLAYDNASSFHTDDLGYDYVHLHWCCYTVESKLIIYQQTAACQASHNALPTFTELGAL